ncbi:MAG: hypothetical protein M1816_000530 [Peltula sp. TS41687]|nr:MAG: hypothetical protein M1816_000530 [Peltula sp. TS41687]
MAWTKEPSDHIKRLHERDNALFRPRPERAVPNTQGQGIGTGNHAHARHHLIHRWNMVTGDSYATTTATATQTSSDDISQTMSASVGTATGTPGEISVASLTGYSPETSSEIARATSESSSESVGPSSSLILASVIQAPPTASESGRVSLVVLPVNVSTLSTSATTEVFPSHTQSTTQTTYLSSSTTPPHSTSYESTSTSEYNQTAHVQPTSFSSSLSSSRPSSSLPPTITSKSLPLPSSSGSGNSSVLNVLPGSTPPVIKSDSPTSTEFPAIIVSAAGQPTSTSASAVNLGSLLASLSESLAAASSSNSTLPSSTTSRLITSTSSSSRRFTAITTEPSSSGLSSTLVRSTSTTATSATGATGTTGGLGPGTGPASSGGVAPTNRPADGGSAPSSNQGPPTPVLVGGVVGGVAGLAILIVLFLFLLRWRKHKQQQQTLAPPPSAAASQRSPPSTGVMPPDSGGAMTQTSSPPRPIGAAGFLDRFRPTSQQTASSDTAPSERGFYRVAGRKIAPALTTGGDGYQGPTLSETSFYRDDGGFYGGPGSSARPVSEGGFSGRGSGASEGIAVMRPSPARRAVTSEGPSSVPTLSPPVGTPSPPRRRPDALGRSLASHDGSRGSRFTEDVV